MAWSSPTAGFAQRLAAVKLIEKTGLLSGQKDLSPLLPVNRFRILHPNFGRTALGIVYIEFDVPKGSAPGIARFCRRSSAHRRGDERGATRRVQCDNQELIFLETGKISGDGHHIQIYVADFSGPYERLPHGVSSRKKAASINTVSRTS